MTSRQLVLWRHGRTAWNVEGRAQGQTDVPLDDVGRGQAREAAARLASLAPSLVWSSDLSRASDTATELTQLNGVDLRLDARLREIHVGARQGMTFVEARARFPSAWEAVQAGDEPPRAPGGEVEAEVGIRMAEVIRDAVSCLGPGEVGVLVSHGVSIRVGLCCFLGLPQEHWRLFSGVSNCAWVVLAELRGGWRLVDYNAGSLPQPVLSDDQLATAE